MDESDKKRSDKPSEPTDPNQDNVVDIAIARMKSGAVVKEERKKRLKFILFAAIGITALAAFSTLDFVYQTPESETAANGDIVIKLKRGQSGHFLATGAINGESVRFIVDTGASSVSIPVKVAEKLGLDKGEEFQTRTANGFGTSYETEIETIELGDIKLTNVRATISNGLTSDEALLGLSFLDNTDYAVSKNGIMTITY